MKPYRVEIFDSSFHLIEFLNLYKLDIHLDYLTLEKSTIKVLGNSIVNKGNYLFLMQGKDQIYSGIGLLIIRIKMESQKSTRSLS